jgi:ElaA protein
MEILFKKFKDLELDELYGILKLRHTIFVIEKKYIYQEFDELDKSSYHVFGKIDNKIISYVRLTFNKTDVKLSRFMLDKSYRDKGLSKDMFELSLKYIKKDKNIKKIKIDCQENMCLFFEKHGFVATSETYLMGNIAQVDMELQI